MTQVWTARTLAGQRRVLPQFEAGHLIRADGAVHTSGMDRGLIVTVVVVVIVAIVFVRLNFWPRDKA